MWNSRHIPLFHFPEKVSAGVGKNAEKEVVDEAGQLRFDEYLFDASGPNTPGGKLPA